MNRFINSLLRSERGSIMPIAAIGLVVLVAILALSIDHGRNFITQSDQESKLTAITKRAGDEFTYWEIRRQINASATALGQPLVANEDCNKYVLCDASITEAQALAALQNFVQTEMRRASPEVTIDPPIIRENSQKARYLYFSARENQNNQIARIAGAQGQQAPTIATESGVLINDIQSNAIATQVVFSLDKDSATQFNAAGADQVQQVFDIVQRTLTDLSLPANDFRIGLTIGNLPVRGPTAGGSPTGAVQAGGLDCSINGGLGFSGPCYDNSDDFDGADIGTMRLANQARKYVYEGEFIATDATSCGKPVWTYRNVLVDECKVVYRKTSTYGDTPLDCSLGASNPPPAPPGESYSDWPLCNGSNGPQCKEVPTAGSDGTTTGGTPACGTGACGVVAITKSAEVADEEACKQCETWDSDLEKCVKDTACLVVECDPGFVYKARTGACVPAAPTCGPSEAWEPTKSRCVVSSN